MNRKEEYRKYLASEDWAEKRAKKKQRRNRCAICGDTKNLQVHHLNYRNWTDVQQTDLRKLCDRCHGIAHELMRTGTLTFPSENHHSRFAYTKMAVLKEIHARGQQLYWPTDGAQRRKRPPKVRKEPKALLSKEDQRLKAREAIRTIQCPECGASVGELCRGARNKPRVSNHLQRVQAFSERKKG